jgi:integrase
VADALKALAQQQARHTVGDLWAMWLAERAKDGLSNTIYNANWKALGATFAGRSWDRITTDDCREYARNRFAAGIAPATVNTELSRLRSCLHWAESMNHIGRPPKIWVPSPGKPRDIVLAPDEAAKLIAAARQGDFHVGVFTVLLFATGGRHSAILDLTWDRIDFDRGVINLEDNLPPDPMHKTWRKGRAEVVMSKMARAVLMEAYAGRTCAHVVEHGGRRLKSVREGFANAVRRAELPDDITPHVIRHTVASWQQGKVATAFTAQLLGHRDEGTTRKVYQHPTAELTRPAIEVIDATLAALPELTSKPAKPRGQKAAKSAEPSKVD